MKPHARIHLILINIAIVFYMFIAKVEAHGGRLDKNGGHYNRATGHYHYHSGPIHLLEQIVSIVGGALILASPFIFYHLYKRVRYPHRVVSREYMHAYYQMRGNFVKEYGGYPKLFAHSCNTCTHEKCFDRVKRRDCDLILQDYALWLKYKKRGDEHSFISSRVNMLKAEKTS